MQRRRNRRGTRSPRSLPLAGIADAAAPAGSPSVFAADKGKLRITINGQTVGSPKILKFLLPATPGSRAVPRARAYRAARTSKLHGQLKLTADGAPMHYDWSAEAQKKATGSVEFVNGTAKCAADLGGATPLRKDFVFTSPHIAVLDNNLYYQFARAYAAV